MHEVWLSNGAKAAETPAMLTISFVVVATSTQWLQNMGLYYTRL